MIKGLIEKRALPSLLTMNDGTPAASEAQWRTRRRELIDLLSDQVYGYTPAAPDHVDCRQLSCEENSFANKAVSEKLELTFDTPKGPFSFPFDLILPKSANPAPLFIAIAFRPNIPDRYLPMEEIIDSGYGVATFYYNDVTTDNGEETGLMLNYPRDAKTGWGKIGMWAFAASRIMDYVLTRDDIDHSRVAVIGHSRLGKTALWCGAQDERFSMVISNDSGCSGAAITRDKAGEDVKAITNRFPYWFCGNYQTWAEREHEMPFEQHMLLALTAPRHLYVCSAEEDQWADPVSEFLSSAAASPAWDVLGKTGLVTPDHLPAVGDSLHEGTVGYHLRSGSHFLSRIDWLNYIAYRNRHNI
ncbi:MAG: acetylxylan esterase [Clostridia bacterium]|nr:acetylxylan esterase [Clostridia bacterium]